MKIYNIPSIEKGNYGMNYLEKVILRKTLIIKCALRRYFFFEFLLTVAAW